MLRHPALGYVAPFVLYIAFLALRSFVSVDPTWEYPVCVVSVTLVLLIFSRRLLNLKFTKLGESLLVGVLVFVIWIAPDLIWPGYRGHWLFQNPLVSSAAGYDIQTAVSSPIFVFARILGTAALVPVIEELFWRGWLMRYLISSDFLGVPMGTYAARSFWPTALLFAGEHGPYWEVGLAAGILYNWWAIRTKNLSDCILAHAVTNACIAFYVLDGQRWQYWS